ncbi:MAG: MBOAT family protein [Spirochaetes bacterium]|nr:MBOAT family protein [Spirochaetota bacterium]
MAFDSLTFLAFFISIVFVNYMLPHRLRVVFLLLCSYVFYMSWELKYGLLLFISTVITFSSAILISSSASMRKRRILLVINMLLNFGILLFYKYFNMFGDTFNSISELFHSRMAMPDFHILLPIGISFYTFKAVGYTIDVYRDNIEPERNFFSYALFVSFFPQLVAGPIDRSKNLLPQIRSFHAFDYTKSMAGIYLMAWGFFKKLVIADRIAILVDSVYNSPHEYTGLPLIVATLFYAFQIYCDFSGYSDIAIGAGEVLGFNFIENFNSPYHAKTIREFWQRWHISLSTWFRDYLYIPLGGKRVTTIKKYRNIMITFIVSGLWHGADWKFIIWGGLHGMLLVISYVVSGVKERFVTAVGYNKFPRIRALVQVIIVFLLVDVGWIFFRGNTFSDSLYILTHLFSGIGAQLSNITRIMPGALNRFEIVILFIAIIVMEFVELLQKRGSVRERIQMLHPITRWSLYYSLIFITLILRAKSGSGFVYFQF